MKKREVKKVQGRLPPMQFMSRQTGIVMNNQMDDFASPNIGKAPFFLTIKKLTYILFWNTIPEQGRYNLLSKAI
jgi:hypothetical protein